LISTAVLDAHLPGISALIVVWLSSDRQLGTPRSCDSCSAHVAGRSAQDLIDETEPQSALVHAAILMFLDDAAMDPKKKKLRPIRTWQITVTKEAKLGSALSV
jgi:hypothetical protein